MPKMTDEQRAANAAKRHPPFNSETGKKASQRAGFVAEKMRQWRAENPDAPLTDGERKKMIRAILREGTPDALQALHNVVMDPEHKDHFNAAKTWVEQDIGRPAQAIDLGNGEKGPLRITVTQDDTGML